MYPPLQTFAPNMMMDPMMQAPPMMMDPMMMQGAP